MLDFSLRSVHRASQEPLLGHLGGDRAVKKPFKSVLFGLMGQQRRAPKRRRAVIAVWNVNMSAHANQIDLASSFSRSGAIRQLVNVWTLAMAQCVASGKCGRAGVVVV